MGQLGGAEVGLPAHRLVAVDRALAAGPEHGEAVVLARDLDPPGREVLDRVVGAAVAEAQLVGLEADGAAEQLVAEADAEDRHAADERRAAASTMWSSAAGSPGPLASITASGAPARISRGAACVHGWSRSARAARAQVARRSSS